MSRIQKLAINTMTLKERVKFILVCLLSIIVITGALFFFINVSGITIMDIFAGADIIYYTWRDVLALLYLPVMGYADVLVFLFLFLPFTFRLTKLWVDFSNVICVYAVLAFFLTLPLSFYISFFPLADYYSCGLRGPFSGAYYVKDLKMCEQFEYHPESGSDDVSIISVTPSDKK